MAAESGTLPYLQLQITARMNYLAHAYLSFNNPLLTVGNMIADFVKGRQWQQYEAGIQQGIQLHRAIDAFTDQHPATLQAREYFQPSCGRYSAVFIDLVYDHFLAADDTRFSDASLLAFSLQVFRLLEAQGDTLPLQFRQVLYYMRRDNWLYHYRSKEGVYQSFGGIVRRARFLEVPANVPFAVLENHYDALAACYRSFFPEITAFVQQRIG